MANNIIDINGSVHYINSEGEMKLNNYGSPIRESRIIHDITVIKELQIAIKISDEKYKTLLNASPDGIILINLKEEIIEVSEICLELIGASGRSEVLGKQFSQYVSVENRDIFKMIIEKTRNEGLIQNVELKLLKKNGTSFISETSGTLIQRQEGTHISFMFIIRDISQRKKNEVKQIFADRMANLGEMASGMAHEINQPLNIISMTMDKILFEFNNGKSISENVIKLKSDKIFENIDRIKNIIDHVRSFSRTNNNYVLSEFSVNENIEKTIPMFSEQMKYHDIKMILKLENDLPKILGNTYKFEQVLINLVINAKDALLERKANEEKFNDMQIAINSYAQNSNVFIEVIDNGIGIDKDDHEKILMPFYTTKKEGKGTGLGLSICYQLIKEMGGAIYITSDYETGTKFTIQF
jgi:histidine kinase